MRRGQTLAAAVVLVAFVTTPALADAVTPLATQDVEAAPPLTFELFLDRLRSAESGGRLDAKNPRSTALGPYQFIKGTFLELARRHFPDRVAGLSDNQILALRTDSHLSRRAASIFCNESLDYLKGRGLAPTFAHLRLAFLLGPGDAARVIGAEEGTPVSQVLSASVVRANPFMKGMTASDLIAKSARDVSRDIVVEVERVQRKSPPVAKIKQCNAKLASCRKYLTASKSGGRA